MLSMVVNITQRRTYSGFWSEEFEDTKLIARIRKSNQTSSCSTSGTRRVNLVTN
jgi:hypothetical protein